MTDAQQAEFGQSFRGYDREQVDAELSRLKTAVQQARQVASTAQQESEARVEHLRDDMTAAEARIERLQEELTESKARATDAEQRVQRITSEVAGEAGASGDDGEVTPARFAEILRIAEEQASTLVDNAAKQSERMIDDAMTEIEKRKRAADEEAARIVADAKHEEQQAQHRLEGQRSAHEAAVEEREGRIGERIGQAESEASVLLAEAERATSALRAQSARESDALKTEAERIMREAKARELELDAAVKRRQDESQQEFLRLHNQAIAHAERITTDANEKVRSALQHADHIAEQSQAFEDLAKAQAAHVQASAAKRASAMLGEARTRSQAIVDAVLTHTRDVLHESEDRARSLRWQQQQLTGFTSEVQSLMRIAETARSESFEPAGDGAAGSGVAGDDASTTETGDSTAAGASSTGASSTGASPADRSGVTTDGIVEQDIEIVWPTDDDDEIEAEIIDEEPRTAPRRR